MHKIGFLNEQFDDTPVWRIGKNQSGVYEPMLVAWYTEQDETKFLTHKTFGSMTEAEDWLKEFWQAYWRL